MPRIIPACVIAGVVMVGDIDALADIAPARIHRLRQTEVQHLHCAVRAHLDVGGLQVAVDDPLLVRRFQRLSDLLRDGECFVDRHGTLRDAIRERWALDEFHHQRRHAIALLEAVNLRDMRVVQRRQDFGLTLESRQPLRVRRNRRGQHLDRNGTLQVGVRRPIHLPHAAHSDLGGDFIGAEASAGGQGHLRGADYRRKVGPSSSRSDQRWPRPTFRPSRMVP